MKKIVSILVLALTLPVQSQLITVGLTAQVHILNDFDNVFQGDIAEGDLITGYYKYDLNTPDTNPSSDGGLYYQTVTGVGVWLTVQGKGYNFQTDPSNVFCLLSIANNHAEKDSYSFISYNSVLFEGHNVEINFGMEDPTTTAISNDLIPTSAPNIAQWSGFQGLWITGRNYDSNQQFDIVATILEFHDIPEPATFLLTSLGILALRKRIS